jgi:putative tryptophan/tyrosine transport system substrate-binding protein
MSRIPTLIIAICLWLTCAAAAQTPGKSARIGMLCPVRCAGIGYTAFDDELRKLGWFEGRNLTVERRASEGRYERLPELAAELVRSRPDLIVAASVQPARAAKDATSEIPIVFSFVADPVGMGLVQSLARPGGNATGVTALIPGAFLEKHLEMVKELLPKAQRVAILTNPANEDARRALSREAPIVSQLGLQLNVIQVHRPEDIPAAIASAKGLGADALLIMGDTMLNTPANIIPHLAAQVALPAIYQNREAVQTGGLIAYIPDLSAIARRHAHFVDRVLRGASPSDLPVEQPNKYDLIINLKTAKALRLTIPAGLLALADELIE